ncbi:MAG: copper homeostasis protein CutC [Nocardioidaceae bacterium]
MTTVPGALAGRLDPPSEPSLEVVVLHPTDAERAQAGGANRLHACVIDEGQAMTLEPAAVSAIVRATDLPVRVTLRLSEGFTTQGGEFTRLVGLVTDFLSLGVEGFVFGFLTADLDVDVEICTTLADNLAGAPWTFDRAFDHALDARRAWRQLAGVSGLDAIHTAGSVFGMAAGVEDLVALAQADARFASAVVAAGGVRAEDVPWLVRSGVRRLHLGSSVRPGGSWAKSHVDTGFVRSWRLLLDDSVERASGEPGPRAQRAQPES